MKLIISPEEEKILREHYAILQKIFIDGNPYKALIKALQTFPPPHNIIAQRKYSQIKFDNPYNPLASPKEKTKTLRNFIDVLGYFKIEIPETPKEIEHLLLKKGKSHEEK